MAAGKTDEAQSYVNAARQLGSAGAALAAVERSLTEANRAAAAASASRRQPAAGAGPSVDSMVSDVRQRMNDGKLIDPPGDSARDMLDEAAHRRADAP